MYIKYIDQQTGVENVRDIRHFKIVPQKCKELDGSTTDGAVICDGSVEIMTFFADMVIESATSYAMDGAETIRRMRYRKLDPPQSVTQSYEGLQADELAWFSSAGAAKRVLNFLCEALDAGRQYFDFTIYDEAGLEK